MEFGVYNFTIWFFCLGNGSKTLFPEFVNNAKFSAVHLGVIHKNTLEDIHLIYTQGQKYYQAHRHIMQDKQTGFPGHYGLIDAECWTLISIHHRVSYGNILAQVEALFTGRRGSRIFWSGGPWFSGFVGINCTGDLGRLEPLIFLVHAEGIQFWCLLIYNSSSHAIWIGLDTCFEIQHNLNKMSNDQVELSWDHSTKQDAICVQIYTMSHGHPALPERNENLFFQNTLLSVDVVKK